MTSVPFNKKKTHSHSPRQFCLFVFSKDKLGEVSYLSDGSLRVKHEVAEHSLEYPSELRQEAGVVGDGP